MFTKAEVRNSSGGLLTLQLGDSSSGINVLEVAGLDPVKATLTSSNFANQDGAIFQSGRRETRNITMKLGIDPDPSVVSVGNLRRQVYGFFIPNTPISLKFFVDDTDDSVEDGYHIDAVVETCESPMFAQSPEVDLSLVCFDPDFIDPVPVTVTGLHTTDTTPAHVAYDGTSKAGFIFTINIDRALSEFTLYYTDPNGVVSSMDVVASFIAGDVVTISTVPGDKYANLLRSGVTSSVLYAISPQSIWPKFSNGDNYLRVYATGAAIPASFTYTKRYGGL